MAPLKLTFMASLLLIVALVGAKEEAMAPSPTMQSGSNFVSPALAAIFATSLLSFFALFNR
ncbi:hypothetical protein AMTRI_Chr03g139410 [Amborella trichopoda]|uniref:Uncharacterized protein n=1 Tax=Amborella trichopoda TaxID=13333 RepID=W1PVM7_AMBTC|nr:hypothetical protein AMTR_s00022p00240960 [Amborella trichopoda]